MTNQFTVLGELTLDDLYDLPSSTLYRFLKPLKKEVFDDNERILFYNYSKIGNDLLEHLYQILLYLDIPDFFVTVISNQQSTAEYLENRIRVELVNTPENPSKIKPLCLDTDRHYCAHAWVGVHLNPNGEAKPCCDSVQFITDEQGIPYNIKDSSAGDILNSQWMKDLRQSFRDRKQHPACVVCYKRESAGMDSRRTLVPYKLENIYGQINWEDEGQLMYIGSHLGNLCNLKCRICTDEFSSSIAIENLSELPAAERKQSPSYQIIKSNSWPQDNAFWDRFKTIAPKIKNYEILGGEPFLLKQNIDFIHWLVETGLSQDVCFYFSTNGTQYPDIFDQADQFRRLEIVCSIDNLGKRFEFERYGAVWAEVENNINRLINAQTKFQNLVVDLCITINIQNVYYLPEILRWRERTGFNSHYINYVYSPREMSIESLTPAAKKLVLDRLTCATSGLSQPSIDTIQIVVNTLSTVATSDGQAFCQSMKRLDRLRNQNFADLYPEVAKSMGYL